MTLGSYALPVWQVNTLNAGTDDSYSVRVEEGVLSGGTSGAVAVDWEIVAANGSRDDVSLASGTLSWNAGDAADKTIDIPLVNDGASEGLEHVLVRLTAPSGGATLAAPNVTMLHIGDPGDTPVVGFAVDEISVPERGFATAVLTLQRTGSASGSVSVDYAMTGGDAVAGSDFSGAASGTISWPDGDANPRTVEIAIIDDGSVENDEFIELTLSNAQGGAIGPAATIRVNVLDGTGEGMCRFKSQPAHLTLIFPKPVRINGARVRFSHGGAPFLWQVVSGDSESDLDGGTGTFARAGA